MLAMFLVFGAFGSLQYADVLPAGRHTGRDRPRLAIGLLLFLGACGKSAQLPLYVWLPDAMEGPTPVSALIHAATMVTAGVYLMARASPILAVAPDVLTVVAWVGAATALFAATIACAQNDIKRVLAYSTISQLGYMFLAVGSWRLHRRHLPHGHARVLQGAAVPRRRQRDPRPARRAGHEAHGRAAQVDADHVRPPSSSGGSRSPACHRSPASGRRTRSCSTRATRARRSGPSGSSPRCSPRTT